MRETNCKFCGDPVVIAESGESVVNTGNFETNMEHFHRTGHDQNQPDDYHGDGQ